MCNNSNKAPFGGKDISVKINSESYDFSVQDRGTWTNNSGVPELPEEEMLEEIPEEDVPLAEIPKTGDASVLWLALSTLSGGLLCLSKKREEKV